MCLCMCVNACVCVWVFTQLEVESGITSPGGGSWGVHCDSIKKADRLWHPLRKQEDFTYENIPALELKKQAKSLQTPAEFT